MTTDIEKLDYLLIPFEEIKLATNNFHEGKKIGEGGFGNVYKAEVDHFDVRKFKREGKPPDPLKIRSTVAIKRFFAKTRQAQKSFLTEIQMLSDCWHNNIVNLFGFCKEGQQMILVYEYASKGSLDGWFGKTGRELNLPWVQRLYICLGAACGLEYLHEGLGNNRRIIHSDVKSANILLDDNFVAMIADFGLSKAGLVNHHATFVPCNPAGTPAYLDPKFWETRILTKKSDVYSFGVVLFEVLSGCLAYEATNDENLCLRQFVKLPYDQRRVDEIIDPDLKKAIVQNYQESTNSSIIGESSSIVETAVHVDSIETFSKIAYQCLQENRDQRPTMPQVVKELQKAFDHQMELVDARRIPLLDIRAATNGFHSNNFIGSGGFTRVYKAILPRLDVNHGSNHLGSTTTVAIKRLDSQAGLGRRGFLMEVSLLSSYRHKNIMSLLGFCEEEGERILVYPFASHGSLDKYLDKRSLTWTQRLKICVDAARGLHYLHEGVGKHRRIIHRDVKSANILLSDDWEASLSDFWFYNISPRNQEFSFIISNAAGTFGYIDPQYLMTGILTKKSDIYSFGTVLFETLCGRQAFLNCDDERRYLTPWARELFQGERLEQTVDPYLMEHINPDSFHIFSTIAYQCTEKDRENRPTINHVVEQLEKALESQENHEWGQKLPRNYEEIISMSKSPLVYFGKSAKGLYQLLSKGILLEKGKWFSLNKDGESYEMVSATTFSYKDRKKTEWKAISNSRFPKVAKMLDLSNLNLKVRIRTQFLRQGITYASYLVFKFCDKKKITTAPVYVELRYKLGKQTNSRIAYFAEWRDSGWMAIDLHHFTTTQETCVDFEVLLEKFSSYYCGRGAIYIEGIEFLPIENVGHEEAEKFKDEKDVESPLKSGLEIDWEQKFSTNYESIIKRAKDDLSHTSSQELIFILSEGILIDKGEKFFYLSKLNGKKCHTLPATAVLFDSSNIKRFKRSTLSESRFQETVEILPHHAFRMKFNIETEMLSPNTVYACYLVYKLSGKCHGLHFPVKARNLLPRKRKETISAYLRSPSPENVLRSTRLPVKREDGWMEVIIWEFNSKMAHDKETLPMHMKLISLEGNMSGIVLEGIEFRP